MPPLRLRTKSIAVGTPAAARIAASEQQVAGSSEGIEYEDASGKWHHELAEGTDRPEADVAEK